MALVTIKQEFLNKRLAFGKSADPLHKRSEQELIELAILAHQSKDPSIIRLFDKLPELSVLKKAKTDAQLKKIAPAAGRQVKK